MILFRYATESDVNFIYESLFAAMEEQQLLERFSATKMSLREALFSENPLAEIIIAEIDDKPAGLCLFSDTQRNFILFQKQGIYIHDIYVNPSYRRQGVAKKLVNKIAEIAKQRNCDRIDWLILKTNTPAIKFWEDCNIGTELDYIHYMRASL